MNEIMAWLMGVLAFVVPGIGGSGEANYAGYIEADYVYAAPMAGGVIADLKAQEGAHIARGEVLFALNASQQQAAVNAAEARVVAAEATLENLETGGRQEEVEVVRAQLRKAEADLALAEQTLERTQRLVDQGTLPRARLDQDMASRDSAEAQRAQLQAQLKVAELPARSAEQVVAQANLDAARADAERARADLADRMVASPVDGVIEKVFYDLGEMAGAGMPVVSIRPDGALTAKFYVGEAVRSGLRIGQDVVVSCDGCAEELQASVTHMASQPEHTPPIIYSREERERLVFLVEAKIEGGDAPLPGQPISVRLAQ